MTHAIGTRSEWEAARRALLEREKELTRMSDALAQERLALPWVPVETEYTFDTEHGPKTLAELFDGRSQLITYHFMFDPDWDEGCPSCSSLGDHIDLPPRAPRESRRDVGRGLAGAAGEAAGVSFAHGLDVPVGVVAGVGLQLRLQGLVDRRAARCRNTTSVQ